MQSRTLDFCLADLDAQLIRVTLQAEDVLLFEENTPAEAGQRPMPDPIVAFVDAARLGMFTARGSAPWLSGAELVSRQVDRRRQLETCRMRTWNLDPGAFVVLANMLLARAPSRAEIVSEHLAADPRPPSLRLDELRLPQRPGAAQFRIDYEQPDRTTRERYLQICLAQEPTSDALGAIYEGLDRWACLPLMGGYPTEGVHPVRSIAVAEPAFLLDPFTVELAFPDLFLCDDDCYAAVINWAQVIDRSVCRVASVVLR